MLTIPFPGSKRNWVTKLRKLVKEKGYKKIYEPFGGSGIISVNLYHDGLIEDAVINDYDHLFDDYEEFLNVKEELVRKCKADGLVGGRHDLSEEEKEILQGHISNIDKKYWKKLAMGSSFCFSTVIHRFDYRFSIKDFRQFYQGLDVNYHRPYIQTIRKLRLDSCDYHEFLNKYKHEFDKDTLLVVDPPYKSTHQGGYECERFGEEDTYELIEILENLGVDYLFFQQDEDFLKHVSEPEELVVKTHWMTDVMTRSDYMAYITFYEDRKVKDPEKRVFFNV